jgi:sugar phosphate permease
MIWRRRHSVLIVLFLTYLICYLDRMAMATAIPFIARDLNLSPLAMGSVLSAFFVGYACMQIPGGLLADRLGPNRVMTASIAGWSVFTGLTGAVGSLPALLATRALFGVFEGPFPATASKAIALWFPPHEVGRANGVQLTAVNLGGAIAPLVVAPVIIAWGWRAAFQILLLPGLLMTVLVWMFVKDSPPGARSEERAVEQRANRISIAQVLKRPAVVWCAVALFFGNIASWGLMNWLPTYLLNARGFSTAKMGIMASLTFLPGAVGYYLGGHISDKYFSRRRHVPIAIGFMVGAVATYAAAVAPSGEWAVAALAFGFLFVSAASAGLFTFPIVAVPTAAVGVAFGIVNTSGQLAGLVSPLLVGYALNVTDGDFQAVFCGFAALHIVSAFSILPLGRAPSPRVAQ